MYIHSPHVGPANSGRHSHSFNELAEKLIHQQLIHSVVGSFLSKTKAMLSLLSHWHTLLLLNTEWCHWFQQKYIWLY